MSLMLMHERLKLKWKIKVYNILNAGFCNWFCVLANLQFLRVKKHLNLKKNKTPKLCRSLVHHHQGELLKCPSVNGVTLLNYGEQFLGILSFTKSATRGM